MSNQEGTNAQKRSLDGDQDEPAPKRVRSNEQGAHGSINNNRAVEEQSTEARKKHNQLCVTLDGLITGCPLKSIKRMALTYLEPKTVEKVKDMDELFSFLEVKGIIDIGKYDKLIEIMEGANVRRGIDEIQKTAKDIKCILENQIPSQEQSAMFHLEPHTSNQGRMHPSAVSETLTKRRPETDGLRQLKGQTEDKLDTVRRLECILTQQAEKAKKLLEEKRSVVIKGNPGEGKTTTALHLIDNEIYTDRRVVVYSPRDWKMVDTDSVGIIVMEDIFGQSDLDPDRLEEWMVYLPTIQEHVDAGKLQVIITTRVDILSKAYSQLGSLKLFSGDVSLMLSSKDLEESEKMGIINRELRRYKRNMNEDHKEKCIANFDGLIGFPKCCSLFAGDDDLFTKGATFFKFPEKYFVENITKLKGTAFLSLAFVFCRGKIFEEDLSPKTMPEHTKGFLTQLASCLQISKKKASITLLRDAYNSYLGLYVTKSISSHFSVTLLDNVQSHIEFSHAIVYEAVGHALGDRCPEMIVKYSKPEYLYQRTYTAAAKDIKSQNVFLPVSVYSLLAERMVNDVEQNKLVKSVAKHSALKQSQFVLKLKKELLKNPNGAKIFLMTNSHQHSSYQFSNQSFYHNLPEACCTTFLECILQADADTVKLVHNEFLEFLECGHKNITDCWKCKEKQTLLELALYYHHFEIADKLIHMNACYTHISLCNAARHDDLRRVQTILDSLKMNKTFRSKCEEAKKALCNAFISGNQSIKDMLLKEGVSLGSKIVRYIVKLGNVNVLLDVVEHMKCHNKWIPHWDTDITYNNISDLDSNVSYKIDKFPFSAALYLAYANEKLDMADCLVKNGVKVSIYMFNNVLNYSQKTVATLIQHLKDAETWDPNCDFAREILQNLYKKQKDDLCRLLIQEGVSLRMKNLPLPHDISVFNKVMQHLKDTGNWDPERYFAKEALVEAFCEEMFDVCELLIADGVSLTMSNLPKIASEFGVSLKTAQKVIQHLKDTGNWNPECDSASKTLADFFCKNKFDICELLIQNGVSLTMENFCDIIRISVATSDSAEEAITHLKDTGNWNPECDSASETLADFFCKNKFDICELLIQNGVSLTMENFCDIIRISVATLDSAEEAITHLKDTGNWNPKCVNASEVFEDVFNQGYSMDLTWDLCYLLIQNGFPFEMENLLSFMDVEYGYNFQEIVQDLIDIGNWNPKCDAASKALVEAFRQHRYDLCDFLIDNGVSLTMENFPKIMYMYIGTMNPTLETGTKKAIKHLQSTGNWNPKCNAALSVLKDVLQHKFRYDVYDLLIMGGVPVSLNQLPNVISLFSELPSEFYKNTIQNLKDTGEWYPKRDVASKALENAYRKQNYDVCNLLIFEGVSLTMKNLLGVIHAVSVEVVEKAIKHLKDAGNWDPKCDDASRALEEAFCQQKFDICDLLIQDRISLTMKNLTGVISILNISVETVERAKNNLKDNGNWDPKCDDASEALEKAFCQQKLDMCELLIHDGVSLTMKTLPAIINVPKVSLETIERAIQNLKHTDNWDPKDTGATEAMQATFLHQRYDVCNLLISKGISQTMKNLPAVINLYKVSQKTVKKAIQHLKDTGSFDPMSDDAHKALKKSFLNMWFDICDMLRHDGVSLTMMHLPDVINLRSLETAENAIQNLQDTCNWDPKCNDASKVLVYAFHQQKYDICELLIQEGVLLTMKNLPNITNKESIIKAIHHLKDTSNWDPECDDASKALENAYSRKMYDMCDLLIKDGVKLMMKNLPSIICRIPLKIAQKAIQHMKDTEKWEPKCDYASNALKMAFCNQMFDVCKLLILNGVSLTMKNLPGIINVSNISLENIAKTIKNLQDAGNWDPKCDDAEAFEKSFCNQMLDGCELSTVDWDLVTMFDECQLFIDVWNLERMNYRPSVTNVPKILLETIERAVQYLKDTGKWDPKCDDASEALEKAFCQQKSDVCELLIHDGVSLAMKNLPGVINVSKISLETIERAIEHLKYTGNWDPRCDDASEALEKAFCQQKSDVCQLLIHDGVSLTMKSLPCVINGFNMSIETIVRVIQHLKDTGNWDPKCNDASEALEMAFCKQKSDVCELLIHDRVSLTMKNLPGVINAPGVSLETIKRAIQNLQDGGNWNPKCDDVTKALENAFLKQNSDVCDVLISKEVSLTMKNLPGVVGKFPESQEVAKNVIQHIKDTGSWYPSCSDASEALENAFRLSNCYVCDLLIQEGVLPMVKTLPWWSLELVTKAVQYLKCTSNWDPKCDDAYRGLETAYHHGKYDVCDLLIQEGVLLTMNTFPWWSLESATKAIQFLKATGSWDCKHDKISRALINAYIGQNYDVCHLLIQEGVCLTVKTLQWWSLESVIQAIKFLKGTRNWDPKCDDVSRSFENAFIGQNYDVCELLIKEGASLTMEICSTFHCCESIERLKKLIQVLKATDQWDPSSEDVESLLAKAKRFKRKDICQILLEEGVCYPQ